jgi:hypothetical protein
MIGVGIALAIGAARLPPVDQCTGDSSFAHFRTELRLAVARKDGDALLELMDDSVLLTFGGRRGKSEFRNYWLANPAEIDKLWSELTEVLGLGCAVKAHSRVFPSMFVQADDLDGFETWIARPGARLRARPALSGRVLAKLSWDVLTEAEPWDGGQWIAVRTSDGRSGHVHSSAVRSPIDYRLIVERRGADWRITYFVAGD